MNAQQLTIEITRLQSQVEKAEQLVDFQQRRLNDDLVKAALRLDSVENRLHEIDKRISVLEKGNDLLWRLVPLLIATLAFLISLYNAFIKK